MSSHRHTERINAGEAAAVCAHYDLGIVHSVHRLRRGSSISPKLILKTSTGLYLLKRRARAPLVPPPPGAAASSKSDPTRVALSHQAQLHLAAAGFPVPRIIGTRADNNSMVQLGDRVYEVYQFIPGHAYDRSVESTLDAGRVLGWYHRLMASFNPSWQVAAITYHNLPRITPRLEQASALRDGGSAGRRAARELGALYTDAAAHVERLGYPAWPTQIIHGDWHPGNLVFHDRRVIAVVDHDSIGRGPRALDAANGALQFSMLRPGQPGADQSPAPTDPAARDPEHWPTHLDEPRFTAFCSGYHSQAGIRLAAAEISALPWLMIEALVTESAAALRMMGRSHLLDPAGLLRMVAGKASWIAANADRLARLV